ncbi:hypothetical protein CSB93_2826 [Pseudomonas paraeruginosa]|uniref:Uncharacterized protein n=1 Tax=Pseudomonas paraeruginosa TaxID=2994495 RepID=A0A2R3IXZ2_9PSED|nr:hypothetical protein CSB93_2826 [Pseudomonas paraeruginosa]AWE89888.1 hypothetical protein CSC28_1597 [Pseudomonas paraeruginosa]
MGVAVVSPVPQFARECRKATPGWPFSLKEGLAWFRSG